MAKTSGYVKESRYILQCESLKILHFDNMARYFHVEVKITSNLTYLCRIIYHISFDITFVAEMFMVDCPSLK